jgi:DNA-binding GntR family transcriptional regulator
MSTAMKTTSRPPAEPWEERLLERWQAGQAEAHTYSTSEYVRRTLADAVVSRDLAPGVRLSEENLASLFGVSRTPVREALVGLMNANLATRDSRGLLRVGSVTSDQILEVYAVRVVLEGFAASAAAQVASTAAVIRLRQLNLACRRAAERGDFPAMALENLRLHAAIAEASGNSLLQRFLDEIDNWTRRIPTTTLAFPGRAEVALAQHDELIDAIQAHDVQRAESLAKQHMQDAERIRIAMLVGEAGGELADVGQIASGSLDGTGTGSSRLRSRAPRSGLGRRGREAPAPRAERS